MAVWLAERRSTCHFLSSTRVDINQSAPGPDLWWEATQVTSFYQCPLKTCRNDKGGSFVLLGQLPVHWFTVGKTDLDMIFLVKDLAKVTELICQFMMIFPLLYCSCLMHTQFILHVKTTDVDST